MSEKERLLSASPVFPVAVGGLTFHVRGLPLAELRAWEALADVDGTPEEVAERQCRDLLARCVCDSKGQPVFSSAEDPDIDRVQKEVLRGLLTAAARKNGLSYGQGEEEDPAGN